MLLNMMSKLLLNSWRTRLFASFEYLGYILINNGGEWAVEFDLLCNSYEITHQYTAPQWPKCNGKEISEDFKTWTNNDICYY